MVGQTPSVSTAPLGRGRSRLRTRARARVGVGARARARLSRSLGLRLSQPLAYALPYALPDSVIADRISRGAKDDAPLGWYPLRHLVG